MKRKLLIALLAAMCLLLCGCAFHNKTLDGQMQAVVTALNEDDEAAFRELLLMPDAEEHELHTLYTDLRSEWEHAAPESAKLMNFSINHSAGEKHCEGKYLFENGCSLSFQYYEGDYGKGITKIGVSKSETNSKLWSIGSELVVYLICFLVNAVVILVTIVDIAVKRPPKYGWYILLALVSVPIFVQGYPLGLPVGAIVWWCIRRSVLRRKAAEQEGRTPQHRYTDTSRDPWEL